MTRRNVKPEPNLLVRAAYREDWPPTCAQCVVPGTGVGWQGEPNDQQSPYIACHGDPARHQRSVVRTS
jgi:hypothetical protein